MFFPGCARVRTKCAEKTCPEWRDVTIGIRVDPRFHECMRVSCTGMVPMTRGPCVDTKWHMCCTRCTDVAKRGRSWLRVDRRGCRSSKEGECNTSAQGLIRLIKIVIPTSCNFFQNSFERTIRLSVFGPELWVTHREIFP